MQHGEENKINIVFAADKNFIEPLSAAISSVLLNSDKDDEFNFYVLCSDFLIEHKNNIEKLKLIKQFSITFLEMNDKDFSNCILPVNLHFSKANYYRLKLPSILSLGKVLYLDCDIIVKKSLKEMYDSDITGKYAAVVEDMAYMENIKDRGKELDIKKYFNSGVMLLNLEQMREDNIENKCFGFVEKFPEKIKFVDQCVLNAVLKDKLLFLDWKYNFQHNYGVENINDLYKMAKSQVVILHFTSEQKPWKFNKPFAIIFEYYKYLNKTSYRMSLFALILNCFNLKIKANFKKSLRALSLFAKDI